MIGNHTIAKTAELESVVPLTALEHSEGQVDIICVGSLSWNLDAINFVCLLLWDIQLINVVGLLLSFQFIPRKVLQHKNNTTSLYCGWN